MKAHTWRVTKFYNATRRAGLHLKTARTWGSDAEVAQCTAAYYKEASKTFNRAKDTDIRKMFSKKMEEEAWEGLPGLSKKAHQAFKGITGSSRKSDRLGDVATWTRPTGTDVTRGHKEVGDLVCEYTLSVSSKECAPGEFDETFSTGCLSWLIT